MAGQGQWVKRSGEVSGVLLDISGVLYNGGTAIPGSVDAVKRLKAAGLPVRFCTNETQITKEAIATRLQGLGFVLTPEEIFPPAPAVAAICKERGLRPYLLVHPDVLPEFSALDQTNPNCVVMGDAADGFSYTNMNATFQTLLTMPTPILIAMGRGKYYKELDCLKLDVGPYMKALEYAADTEAEVVGKPAATFFLTALKDMGVDPQNALMIGDDIVNDVGGAQACGMMGVQVRTGKFRPCDEPHATVVPDGYVDDLAQAVDLLLTNR